MPCREAGTKPLPGKAQGFYTPSCRSGGHGVAERNRAGAPGNRELAATFKAMIAVIDRQIEHLDRAIETLLRTDEALKRRAVMIIAERIGRNCSSSYRYPAGTGANGPETSCGTCRTGTPSQRERKDGWISQNARWAARGWNNPVHARNAGSARTGRVCFLLQTLVAPCKKSTSPCGRHGELVEPQCTHQRLQSSKELMTDRQVFDDKARAPYPPLRRFNQSQRQHAKSRKN